MKRGRGGNAQPSGAGKRVRVGSVSVWKGERERHLSGQGRQYGVQLGQTCLATNQRTCKTSDFIAPLSNSVSAR